MEVTRSRDSETADRPKVRAHATSPERTVFTEDGNQDAWISTDTLVDAEE
ncbi:MAG: hypothetical protein ABEJ05_01090 [Haloglomus sp.]